MNFTEMMNSLRAAADKRTRYVGITLTAQEYDPILAEYDALQAEIDRLRAALDLALMVLSGLRLRSDGDKAARENAIARINAALDTPEQSAPKPGIIDVENDVAD